MAEQKHDDTFGAATIVGGAHAAMLADLRAPVLTIAWHPDVSRIGESSWLNEQEHNGAVELSRLQPSFGPPGRENTALRDKHLSRSPHRMRLSEGGVVIELVPDGAQLSIDGVAATARVALDADQLRRGVILTLASRIVLLLHSATPGEVPRDDLGLIGRSEALALVRERIQRVAEHDVPVLVRGESGTGKELVAQAIHRHSARRDGPLVSVNMAALVPSTAAAALFGHTRGAFTGATDASVGFFGAADGGTLFLDEIGDTPSEVQPAMLRALETGEVQPLGSGKAVMRNVRIIAATDANLERAVDAGTFRLPLLQRLSSYELTLPPLRQRREDIAPLMLHFLRAALARAGKSDRLTEHKPWLCAAIMERALGAAWPGNVRELKNVAQKLVIDWSGREHVDPGAVEALFVAPQDPGFESVLPRSEPDSGLRKALRDIPEDRVVEVLKRNSYRPGPAARELGISRSSLYALIDGSARLRKAGELSSEEIAQALSQAGDDTVAAAAILEVSERGLLLRMKQLGLR